MFSHESHIYIDLAEKQILVKYDEQEQSDHQFLKLNFRYHGFHI